MRRFLVYDHLGNPVCEVSPNDVFALVRREELNGEHSLEVTTVQVLQKGWRVVYKDGRGCWREYVVAGVDQNHESGESVIGTYYCTWSLQHDLQGVTVSAMPGTRNPVLAAVALQAALSTQSRWTVGTVTNTASGGASMYDMSAWKALGVLVDNWGGEIGVTIGVSMTEGVISRAVDLHAQMGQHEARRRYDFGADVRGVRRKYDDAPLYCRVSPRGAGEESGDGYGRKITIESVNGGNDYLTYAPMVDACKMPDGNGGWQYPTTIVENSSCKTPAELKTWAEGILEDACTPKVTYEIDVLQAAAEGVDALGVSLGDVVHVVDAKFGQGVRITARVVSLEVDELDERNATVKLGYAEEGIASKFDAATRALSRVRDLTDELSTAAYIEQLLARINAEINATGGYTYITEGHGIRTYDRAVSDPLVGSEANAVVEIKGGTIRIANSKTAQGEWNWRSVFTSGHIAADMVTAAQLTAGYIGSPSGNYWNLDTGELRMASTGAMVGNQTLEQYVQSHSAEIDYDQITLDQQKVFNALTDHGRLPGVFMDNGQLYVNASYLKTGILTDNVGNNYWNLNTGEFSLSDYATDSELASVNSTATSARTAANSASSTATAAQTAAGKAQTAATAAQTAADKAKAEASKQVGGTNLLIDTNINGMTKKAAVANRYWSHNATNPTNTFVNLAVAQRPIGGVTVAVQTAFTASRAGKTSGICFYSGKCAPLVDGRQYTVSCWARKTAGGAGQLKFQYGQTKYKASSLLNLTTGWKRYSYTFTFKQSAIGGSGGARIYFYASPKTNSATTIQMAGFKLESGGKATDWSPAPEDTNYGITNAEALAKKYTNQVTKADRDFDKSERQKLDASFNQKKVFDRLMKKPNGQKAKGIKLKNNELYINGTYIETDTLDAGIIKTGILIDKAGKNKWNMKNGYFYTKNGELQNCNVLGQLTSGSSNKAQFNEGTVRFFNGSRNAMTIDGAMLFSDGNYGAHITFNKYLVLRGPNLATTTNTSSNGTLGFTGSVFLNDLTHRMNGDMTSCKNGNVELKFINGLFVGIGKYTETLAQQRKKGGNVG